MYIQTNAYFPDDVTYCQLLTCEIVVFRIAKCDSDEAKWQCVVCSARRGCNFSPGVDIKERRAAEGR